METLIFSYHYTVIAIILITTLATIGGMTKVWIFKNVDASYTKVLVGALLVELVAAFVGVYNTLPELKLKVSEKYRFEISYNDILTTWEKGKNEQEKEIIEYFANSGGLDSFLSFRETTIKYDLISHLSRAGYGDCLTKYVDLLAGPKDREYISLYDELFQSSPILLSSAEKLLEEYARLKKASGKAGSGDMWASVSRDKLEGIVVFEFPGDLVPTVLEFDGRRTSTGMTLSFEQKASAFSEAGQIYKRPEGKFPVEFTLDEDVYIGELDGVGEVTIQLWEL